MAAVKLPDGRELEVESGEKARDVAEKIGARLARDALVAKLDGEVVDLDAPVEGAEVFEVVTKDSAEGLYVLRHSTAHAMAQAILELYPGSKLTIGPPIENGFYYDIEVEGRITDDDLPRIEERMREISERDLLVYCEAVSKKEAEKLYEDNPYKLELIEDPRKTATSRSTARATSSTCAAARTSRAPEGSARSSSRTSPGHTGAATRRTPCSPASTAPPGPTEKQLKAYLRRLEEAKERDHRRIGKDLELFTFSPDVGAGIPLFLPKGEMLRHLMEDYVREVQTRHGYDHVWTRPPRERGALRKERTPGALSGLHVSADGGRRDPLPAETDELPRVT